MDEAQPVGDRVPKVERRAVELRAAAGIGSVVARQRLDQRRLARAVLAHERVDLAGLDVERRIDQRARRSKGLRQPSDPQHGRRRSGPVAAERLVRGGAHVADARVVCLNCSMSHLAPWPRWPSLSSGTEVTLGWAALELKLLEMSRNSSIEVTSLRLTAMREGHSLNRSRVR